MKTVKKIFAYSTLLLSTLIASPAAWAKETKTEPPTRVNQLLTQFKSTNEEAKALKAFKSQTMQKTILNALEGNPAAIHWLGLCYLAGANGFEKNDKRAFRYFSTAAGLGYAPAINRVKSMYLKSDNPFMALVYTKVLITQGHDEFVSLYEECKTLENLAPLFEEIEKIAEDKSQQIAQNLEALKTAEDKTKYTVAMMKSPTLIAEDKTLSEPQKLAMLTPSLNETPRTIAQGE